ncbi:MAG: hypothetical protein Q7K39_04240 [Candidatus Magasanikbacteria bacterium]|nr:hypothetical protein [Candidatus Magasanikbacteria bacterium]
MRLTCPECKNDVDLTTYMDILPESVVECNVCGISLMVKSIDGEAVSAEIVDEGK